MGGQHEHGSTALLLASKYGNFKVVQHLIRYGANLEVVDAQRRSALFMAASKGYKDIVAALCNGGARINTQVHAPLCSLRVASLPTMSHVLVPSYVMRRTGGRPQHCMRLSNRSTLTSLKPLLTWGRW